MKHDEKTRTEVVPPRLEEPKLVPTPEAKGFPNPAPKGAWVPESEGEREREGEREHTLNSSQV